MVGRSAIGRSASQMPSEKQRGQAAVRSDARLLGTTEVISRVVADPRAFRAFLSQARRGECPMSA